MAVVTPFPPMTKIIVVNYYWYFKQVKEGAKAAVISFFSFVGVCPEFFRNWKETGKIRKNEQMGRVTHALHQALSEYTVSEF